MNTQTSKRDNPGVIALPPLLYGGVFLLALLLRWLWPLQISTSYAALLLASALLIIAGALFAHSGKRALRSAGTNIHPSRPSTAIASGGAYRYTRNPLYLALTLIYLGLSLAINSWWGPLLLPPLLLLMHFGVILREERYLEKKFGDQYLDYKRRVQRYL